MPRHGLGVWPVLALLSLTLQTCRYDEFVELARAADRIVKPTIITVLVPRLTLSAVEGLRYPDRV